MPAEQSHAMFAAQYDEAIRAGADAAMRAGIRWTADKLRYVLVPLVIVCGILFATGQLGWGKLLSYTGRICVILWLAVGAAYTTHVADLMVDGIPNEIASVINGGGQQITSAQQFDVLGAATSNFTAQIKGQATGLFHIPTRMAADAANGYAKFWLKLFFYLWIVVRIATRLLVATMAFMLLLLLFDSTRGFLMSMAGKLVGLVAWQLMTAIMASVMLAGSQVYLRDAIANPGASLDEHIDRLWDIGGWFLGCFFMLLILPALVGGAAGHVAGVTQGAVIGAIAAGTRLAVGGGLAAGRNTAFAIRRMTRASTPRTNP